MNVDKDLSVKLFNTLNGIKELASPQINSFIPTAPFSRPLYLTFRFIETDNDENNSLYLKLIKAVVDFEGSVIWLMHNYKTSRNYVIEPIEFYLTRRRISSSNPEEVKKYLGEEKYNNIILGGISDTNNLCSAIQLISL